MAPQTDTTMSPGRSAAVPVTQPPRRGRGLLRGQIIFVIPAYNEEQDIGSLLEQTHAKMTEYEQPYQAVIVDDGSTDQTARIVQQCASRMPVRAVPLRTHQGVGAAFSVGLRTALAMIQDGDVVVTKEADNTSDLAILPSMIKHINEGADVVLASCYAKGGGVVGTTPLRRGLSSAANALLRFFFPMRSVSTYSSFYRAHTGAILKQAIETYGSRLLVEDGFVCMVELLVKLAALRIRIAEVPLVLRGDVRIGKSKMPVVRTMRDYVRFSLRNWRLWRRTNR